MSMSRSRVRALGVLFFLWGLAAPGVAAELVLKPIEVIETKAVYGRIEPRDVIPARARIGGVLVRLDVTEGDSVKAGQALGLITDDKLALQLRAADARIRALNSEQGNIRAEAERAQTLLQRGAGTQQRVDQLQTQLEVIRSQISAAEADRAVILQQATEGEIVAPVAGRVLKVPVTRNAVVLPGEPIAVLAGGGYFLRLALPERHAGQLAVGTDVAIGEAGGKGRIAKVFPQIENGRVIADVEIAVPGDYFVGTRVLVQIPVGRRPVLAVPRAAIRTASGIDFVTLATGAGPREVAVVRGEAVMSGGGEVVEILSGLRAGDRVVTP